MNPWLLSGAGVFWVASVTGAGWVAYGAGEANVIAQQVKVDDAIRQTRDAALQGAAQAIAALKPVNTTIVQKVQREIRENTVYAECRVPASGLQLANQAITGKSAEPASGDKLPGAQPAR